MMAPTLAMNNSLPRLLQLSSQNLPVGAYAYSQAQEWAIAKGTIKDGESAAEWIEGVFLFGVSQLDLPALVQAYNAVKKQEWQYLSDIDCYVQASRESKELLLEDIEMGRALRRVLISMNVETGISKTPSFVTQFACAGIAWCVSLDELLAGMAYNWLESQVMVATKSLPLGQSAAQSILYRLCGLISKALPRAIELSRDSDYGVSLHGLAIMSSRHELMEARLYRS